MKTSLLFGTLIGLAAWIGACSFDAPESVSTSESEEQALEMVAHQAMRKEEQSKAFWLTPETQYAEINKSRIESLSPTAISSAGDRRVSNRFPNISLLDQHGRRLKFYDDLVKDKVVIITFFYTRCTGSCPTTTVRLRDLRESLKEEFGQGLQIISLSLEPEVDTPEELCEYRDRYRVPEDPALPPWTFATGNFEELEQLRRALGVYDLDPIIDADKTEHAAILTFGNDRTNRWAALPVGMNKRDLEETIIRIAGNSYRQRYSDAILLGKTQHGHLQIEECNESP